MLMCYVVVPHKPNQIQNKILNSNNNSQALLRINTVCSAGRGSERLIYITRSLLILEVSDKVFSSKEVSFSIIHRLQANVGTLVATLHLFITVQLFVEYCHCRVLDHWLFLHAFFTTKKTHRAKILPISLFFLLLFFSFLFIGFITYFGQLALAAST